MKSDLTRLEERVREAFPQAADPGLSKEMLEDILEVLIPTPTHNPYMLLLEEEPASVFQASSLPPYRRHSNIGTLTPSV